MTFSALLTLGMALLLAGVHLLAGRMRFLEGVPRNAWLSFAGGVSVAYVFVHILPELTESQAALSAGDDTAWLGFLEHHAYLMTLLGLTVFYGLERAALMDRPGGRRSNSATSAVIFWLHVVLFIVYNAIIGYVLVHREDQSLYGLLFFTLALGFHFVVNDFGLREHHQHRYDRLGRWMLSAAVLIGWGIGQAVEVGEAALALLFSFLAGGIVLNVLKEELPEERHSRFWAFALGAALYAALLLLTA